MPGQSTAQARKIWGDGIAAATRYLVLFTAAPTEADPWANELANAHGYTRGIVPPEAMKVAADGDVSLSRNVSIYTASDDAAEDATHLAVADHPDRGQGNLLFFKDKPFADIPAPQQGRTVMIRSGVKIIDLAPPSR